MHVCVYILTIIGSDNCLSPGQLQAIIWTNTGILLIRTLETHISEILSEIHTFSFKKMHLKMSSAKWQQFCLSLNVLTLMSVNIGSISGLLLDGAKPLTEPVMTYYQFDPCTKVQ